MKLESFRLGFRCAGRHVVAVIASPVGRFFAGSNSVARPVARCPRRYAAAGYRRGEGWNVCRDVCGQKGHAEVCAVESAGRHAAGATLLLFGHDTVCPDCAAALLGAGVYRVLLAGI